jgi:hypothetical protein
MNLLLLLFTRPTSLRHSNEPGRKRPRGGGLLQRFTLAALTVLACGGAWHESAHADAWRRMERPAASEPASHAARWRDPRCAAVAGADVFVRTELFFGLSRPGGVVTEAEFKSFLDNQVTPRFPDGLTLLSGVGQFRDSSGATIVEGSKLLILLYRGHDPEASRKIEQIRVDYKRQFQQESVLRADDWSCVSF